MTDNGKNILLSHGGGGKHTRDLINDCFMKAFDNPALRKLGDSSLIEGDGFKLAYTTDTFVVRPLFFPGGDIGHLSICGTVNDLAVSGARPLALSAGFILEEGFSIDELEKITESMKKAAEEAGVNIITGDTKVVEKGNADGIYINTSGIGIVEEGLLSEEAMEPGDKIIVNGPLGDHGIAVLSAREDLPLETTVKSDAATLNGLIFEILNRFPGKVKFMRDATRGGFATVLNEVAEGNIFGISVHEEKIPVRDEVRAICDLLGYDPLYVANEGKVVFIVKRDSAEDILNFIKSKPKCEDAAITGEITVKNPGRVVLETLIGGGRILDMLIGDQLPRIC